MSTHLSDRFSTADAEEFKRVVDAVGESVLETSDEDIHQETAEDGENPEETAEATRRVLLKALSSPDRQAQKNAAAPETSDERDANLSRDFWDTLFLPLRSFILRRLRYRNLTPADAEECADEIIVRIYKNWDSLSFGTIPAAERSKLFQAYVSAVISSVFSEHKGRVSSDAFTGDSLQLKSPRPGASVLATAFASLTIEEQALLHERAVRNKSYLEIQRHLGEQGKEVSASVLRMRYFRTIKKLRSAVEQEVNRGEPRREAQLEPNEVHDHPFLLGHDGAGRPIRLGAEERACHVHIVGAAGSGKTKLLEWMMRGDLRDGQGFALLDPHGALYRDVVSYCAHHVLNREIVLLDLSGGENVVGFNPFRKSEGDGDVLGRVERRVAATLHAWNVEPGVQSPVFEQTLRCVYTEMLERDLSLPQVQQFIACDGQHRTSSLSEFPTHSLRAESGAEETGRCDHTVAARSRLLKFFDSPALTRFMGLPDRTLDLKAIMDAGKIMLVNLAPSSELSAENARVFGSLLVTELFESAMSRRAVAGSAGPRPFYVYMDEFQNFVGADIANVLDASRKFGLYTVLAHQWLEQLGENVTKAVLSSCRIEAVFGGLPTFSAGIIAERMFIRDLDATKILVAIYQTRFWGQYSHNWTEDVFTSIATQVAAWWSCSKQRWVHSNSEECFSGADWYSSWSGESRGVAYGSSKGCSWGSSDSWGRSEGEAEADVPVFVSVPYRHLARARNYTRQEELRDLVSALTRQWTRHCFIKIHGQQTQPMRVPFVESFGASAGSLDYYLKRQFAQQGALPASMVDDLIEAAMHALLEDSESGLCR
ncbi:MAG: type IV secretion system DNA-binding domain-containing protein [Acidobacteriota bacterium]|nr:type IV secretion system DNA-binding domain-containing protein [Acidobacteriota bacterium]